LKQPDLFAKPTISDFTLAKDPLFARLTLDDAEYQLYRQIYEHMKPQGPEPDHVIYLQAAVNTLSGRILGSVPQSVARRSGVDVLIVHTT